MEIQEKIENLWKYMNKQLRGYNREMKRKMKKMNMQNRLHD